MNKWVDKPSICAVRTLGHAPRFPATEMLSMESLSLSSTSTSADSLPGTAALPPALVDGRARFLTDAAAFAAEQPAAQPLVPPQLASADAADTVGVDSDAAAAADASTDILVCVRARPLSALEAGPLGHYPAVLVRNPRVHVFAPLPPNSHRGPGASRTASFPVDLAFGPDDDNDTVYGAAVRPLVPFVIAGGFATVFAYGQTGSGKTFTMTAMQERVARDIFQYAVEYRNQWKQQQQQQQQQPATDEAAAVDDNDTGLDIYVSYFELFGARAFDLLSDRQPVHILEDQFGAVHARNAHEEQVASPAELLALLARGAALRRTEATGKNATSSRTHAVCRLRVANRRVPEAEDGALYAVDLAGSESAADVAGHARERIIETKEINASLAVLKDCIRNRALSLVSTGRFVHVPFRNSKLTMLLKEAFEQTSRRQCRTVVFANISPSVVDTSMTLNTLRYIEPLRVPVPRPTGPPPRDVPKVPSTWTNAYLRGWLAKAYPLLDPSVVCPTESGRQLLRVPEAEFMQRCLRCPGATEKRAKLTYVKLWALHVDSRT
ncbi:hypothetical protein HK405_004275, partial [Cladochytrium tenue]